MYLEAGTEFLQQELNKELNQQKDYHETYNTIKFMIKCKNVASVAERKLKFLFGA